MGQNCSDFESGTTINQNEIQFNALNGTQAFNELNLRTNVGPNGEVSMSEYVSMIYSMNVWAGALDPNGNLQMAAGTYGGSVKSDWSPGPLTMDGQTISEGCNLFDRTYDLAKEDLLTALALSYDGSDLKTDIDCEAIPNVIKYWPASGNAFLFEGIDSGIANMQYSDFWDANANGIYEPCAGDLPIVFSQGCEPGSLNEAITQMPDQLSYWIMNDNSNAHELTNTVALQVEVHNYAFLTNARKNLQGIFSDGSNNQSMKWLYKIINKSPETKINFHFSTWFDYDLGCPQDDFAGVVPSRNAVVVYNQDDLDGLPGTDACDGSNSYADQIPSFSMDLLKGLRYIDESGFPTNDGLTSVVFPEIGNGPQTGAQYYNLMRGLNLDGSDIIDPDGNITKIMFGGNPDQDDEWSMCSENGIVSFYTTAVMSSGPVDMLPGTSNEVEVGFSYSTKEDLPCPDLNDLLYRADITQANYDNCNYTRSGPSAPNLVLEEGDTSFDLIFDNEYLTSNNQDLGYKAPYNFDNFYLFEGYKLYQVASADFDLTKLDDLTYSRIIYQADLENQSGDLFNYYLSPDAVGFDDGMTIKMVAGADEGVTGRYTVDYDYLGQLPLQVGKEYHYVVVAYAKSTVEGMYDPQLGTGERRQYLEGCHNVKVTTVMFGGTNGVDDPISDVEVSTRINGFTIENNNQYLMVELISINGQSMGQWSVAKGEKQSQNNLEETLPSGMYLLNIRSRDAQHQSAYKISVVR